MGFYLSGAHTAKTAGTRVGLERMYFQPHEAKYQPLEERSPHVETGTAPAARPSLAGTSRNAPFTRGISGAPGMAGAPLPATSSNTPSTAHTRHGSAQYFLVQGGVPAET